MSPSHSVYIRGERVTLTCSPPDEYKEGQIQYYHQGKEIHSETHIINSEALESAGEYSCGYWIEINGRRINSLVSNNRAIRVRDIPPAPSISQSPFHSVYIRGEAVTLTCFVPNEYSAYQIQYYKHGREIYTRETNERNVKYAISTDVEEAAGNYSCTYWTKISDRNVNSLLSNILAIRITAQPPAPSISLNPSHSVYIRGEHVTLSCSPPDPYKASGIQYSHQGKEIHSTTYIIYTEAQQSAGNYSCGYWIETHNRKINSMSSVYVTIQITDIPPAPSISLNPFHSIYIRGEPVTLTCSVPDRYLANQIEYYQHGREIHTRLTDERTVIYVISTNNAEVVGNYSCSYWTTIFNRNIHSSVANSVAIRITDIPSPPSIVTRPSHPVYLKGESINMTCSTHTTHSQSAASKVQFYKDENQIQVEEAHDGEATYLLFISGLEDTGHFLCKYITIVSGREILSEPSQSIQVTVVDVPNPPSIDLIPAHPVYLKGESVNMTCSVPGYVTIKNILYYKDGEVIQTKDAHERKATFLIPDMDIAGDYVCRYVTIHSGREIQSQPRSAPIRVVDHPRPPSLMLLPEHKIYITEEPLTIICYGCTDSDGYKIYKSGHILQNSNSKSNIFRYSLKLQTSSNGSYTCTCIEVLPGGRQMETKSSYPENVFVSNPPPAPYLTLAQPVQKTENGFQVTLNCSAENLGLARNFSFWRMEGQYNPTQSRKVTSVSGFLQWEVEAIENVAFSCSYEDIIYGRTIESKSSEVLNITLMASLFSPTVIAAITGGLSVLLCLIVVFLFYMKYKRQNKLNNWRFSWYWNDKRRNPFPCPVSSDGSTEKKSKTVKLSDSLNKKPLSIATVKDEDDVGTAFKLSTFKTLSRKSKDLSLQEPHYGSTFI
ncbi:uncharacterized protein LOC121394448 [Xenopus laevis]|uniref:Uncharacterized protein LOC121394448 n=1 Tax=Xenopus laevis TaxID=8355 RepID=A0A8J1KXB2_XENLA|nr:uncharacterized protein LOC121394448 [Xenopus laevis]